VKNDLAQSTLGDLIPYQQIPHRHPDLFPEKKWKWMVANRANNGLSRAFCKVGKVIYVNEKILADCINDMHG